MSLFPKKVECSFNVPSFHSSGQPYIHEKKISLNKESSNFAIVSFQMLKLPQSLHAPSPTRSDPWLKNHNMI